MRYDRDPSDRRVRRRRPLTLLATAVLALAACSDVFPPTHPYSTLEVRVTSDRGEPLSGIGLVLYDWKREMGYGQTGFDGTHVFRYIPEGGYGVWIGEPAGYRLPEGANPYVDGIGLAGSAREEVELVLIPLRGTLRVRAMEPDSVPVAGVRLTLYDTSGRTRDGVTGADGAATFELRVGEYGVRAVPPAGYAVEPESMDGIAVTEEAEAEVTFVLTPAR